MLLIARSYNALIRCPFPYEAHHRCNYKDIQDSINLPNERHADINRRLSDINRVFEVIRDLQHEAPILVEQIAIHRWNR